MNFLKNLFNHKDEKQSEKVKQNTPEIKSEPAEPVKDIDGNIYKTVKIGNQIWMAENLKVIHYRNGDLIPEIKGKFEWEEREQEQEPAWCCYENDTSNIKIYGLLYNWYAVSDRRSIAPEGWRVPTDDDWKELEMCLGMNMSDNEERLWRGTNEGSKLAGNTSLWDEGNLTKDTAFGKSSFSALPAGLRNYSSVFVGIGFTANFWTSTAEDHRLACHRKLDFTKTKISRQTQLKRYGFSVRCIKE